MDVHRGSIHGGQSPWSGQVFVPSHAQPTLRGGLPRQVHRGQAQWPEDPGADGIGETRDTLKHGNPHKPSIHTDVVYAMHG